MTKDYPQSVAAHGVRLTSVLASPVEPPGQSTDLLVVMEYESVDMFWAERGAGLRAGPALADLWDRVDQVAERRERRLLTAQPVSWPPPTPGSSTPRLPQSLHRSMLILRPAAPLDAAGKSAWLAAIDGFSAASAEVSLSSAGFHIIQGSSSLPDHLTWDIVTAEPPNTARLLGCLPSEAILVHALRIGQTVSMSATAPLGAGFKRVVLIKAFAGQEQRVDAAQEVVGRSTDIIRNWCVTRLDPEADATGWTHAFEMEFEALSDLAGAYRTSPYHWAMADALFHPETPDKAGTGFLSLIYPITRSYLCEL
jgi:hypothetical protein